jgi:DNA-binding NarL/FixJ family response regulator
MNFANPILICDENDEFRILIRDMLTKNGFFHVLEAANAQEAIDTLKDKKGYFILIESKELTNEMSQTIEKQKNFIVFAENSDPKTISLAARLGVNHIMSYPFHSRKLIDKINSLI